MLDTPLAAAIDVSEVSRDFTSEAEVVHAVRGVSLTVYPSEFVTLVGPSGCGKSTLLNLIAGLDTPTSGSVSVDGRPVDSLSESARARLRLELVGTVFQEHNLIPEFTALENVMLPAELRGTSRSNAARAARESLDRVGLVELSRRFPSELSGGQRQRVGIARALCGERRVLLADEATGALDQQNSIEVFATLQRLAAEGVAVLAATHDPLAAEFAARTLFMTDGRISESDLHNSLARQV